ncbi:uncharacterized protein ccdc15 isoform X3 [Pseudoliparis swirei]|uniref:uncharacterized protein ccdc15 isoform X3 n=1 Tax=Pseudoliparis swirei TaxID=2059687 RepID=UPI0024BDB391|nr:uncharacterized protein ccdc15 isoform X3 [Pseudoliparis swirei]
MKCATVWHSELTAARRGSRETPDGVFMRPHLTGAALTSRCGPSMGGGGPCLREVLHNRGALARSGAGKHPLFCTRQKAAPGGEKPDREEEEEEEEEEDHLFTGQHECPLVQQKGTGPAPRGPDPRAPDPKTSRVPQQAVWPLADQEHLRRQRQSQFVSLRRLYMNMEREKVKEKQQNRKHLQRTARPRYSMPRIVSCDEEDVIVSSPPKDQSGEGTDASGGGEEDGESGPAGGGQAEDGGEREDDCGAPEAGGGGERGAAAEEEEGGERERSFKVPGGAPVSGEGASVWGGAGAASPLLLRLLLLGLAPRHLRQQLCVLPQPQSVCEGVALLHVESGAAVKKMKKFLLRPEEKVEVAPQRLRLVKTRGLRSRLKTF